MEDLPTALDVLAILTAIYQVQQPREGWLAGVLHALWSTAGRGGGVGGVLYDLSGEGAVRVDALESFDIGADWHMAGLAMHSDPALTPRIIAGYRSLLCATLPELPADGQAKGRVRRTYARHQVGGQVMINGIDCSGKGCALYLFSPVRVELSAAERDIFSRLATHVATGYRLQRQLAERVDAAASGVEAVLTPEGRIEHVEAPAQSRPARQMLTAAVRRRERTRTLGAIEPQRALRRSRGLIDARWTLVDQYERGGSHYILARENAPAPSGSAGLSKRERQVVALATLGRTNKMIAYELGLAHSTVRVLMARASAKLHTASRRELVAQQRAQAIR